MISLSRPTTAAVVILASFAPASAELGDQLHKLNALDPSDDAWFGHSVAVSGNVVVVGVRLDDEAGTNAGAAYVFDASTGAQVFKFMAADASPGDNLGSSVGLSGSIAIVGAHKDNGQTGAAYLFDVGTGEQLFKLIAEDGVFGDGLGWSVGISEKWAVAGAPESGGRGAAYVFDTTTGEELRKLEAPDGAVDDLFGWSVGISGADVVVGAYHDDDDGTSSGSAYLFGPDFVGGPGPQWKLRAKLTASDAGPQELFGYSVAISGRLVVVGAPWHNEGINPDAGCAYVFNAVTGEQLVQLSAAEVRAGAQLGRAVAVRGRTAVVGAHLGDFGGHACVFDAVDGHELAKIRGTDTAAFDQFGFSVAIGEQVAVVGARFDDDGGTDAGSAYIFDVPAGPSPVAAPQIVTGSDETLLARPNPFRASTRLTYGVDGGGPVRVAVLDIRGRLVRTLIDERREPGQHAVIWDGSTDGGGSAAPGVYLMRVDGAGGSRACKVVRIP